MKLSTKEYLPGWECRCDVCMTAITHGAPVKRETYLLIDTIERLERDRASLVELHGNIERNLQYIVAVYDARSELFTNDTDCAATLVEHINRLLKIKGGKMSNLLEEKMTNNISNRESPDDGPQIGMKEIWGEKHHDQRYDVIYSSTEECHIEPHFCREWDEDDRGCYGTNPDHGFSKEEALMQQIEYYVNVVTDLEMQLQKLKSGEENELE